jgi:predicted RNA-binding protein with TRAM domain
MVGESEVQTIVRTTDVDATIEIGDSISVTVTATDSGGNAVATSPTGSVVFVRGATVSAQGSGFKPGSPVEVWLNSDPVLLGSGFANSNGELAQTFDLSVDVPLGDHTLVLHGISPEDDVVTMALGVSVVETDAAEPQDTDGGMSRNWIWILVGAPLVALVALARRRGAFKK